MKSSILLALITLPILFIIMNGYQNELTENKYIVNTYMYIILAILLVAQTFLYLDENTDIVSDIFNSRFKLIALFILSITSLITTLVISKDRYVIKHLSWLIYIIIASISTYPIIKHSIKKNKILQILITIGVLVSILSYIAFTNTLDKFLGWGDTLLFMLTGLIIFESVDMLFSDVTSESFFNRIRIYSYIGIIVFSGFILYDTQHIILNSKIYTMLCSGNKQLGCVDYTNQSLHMYLDLLNMFNFFSITS